MNEKPVHGSGTGDPTRTPTTPTAGERAHTTATEGRASGTAGASTAPGRDTDLGRDRYPGGDDDLGGDLYRNPRHGGNGTGRSQASVTTLLRDLADDAAVLTRKEVALARTEIEAAISGFKTGLISTASGGAVLFAGILFLLLSATYALATVVQAWLAALIVGGVVTLIGIIMVMAGKRKLQAEQFRPDRTVDSMRKDREMLHRRTS
jgi:hypothetical protein